MSKVIIVGAGASIDASKGKLPSATNFFERIRGNSELMSLLESPEIKTALSTLLPISLTDEASYKRLDKLNIEELFTLASLEAEMDSTDRRLWHLTELIRKTIVTCSEGIDRGGRYRKFVEDQIDANTSVITFNWDILLDQAFDDYCPPGAPMPNNFGLHWSFREICTAEATTFTKGIDWGLPLPKFEAKPAYLKLHGSVDAVVCRNQNCRRHMQPFRVTQCTEDHFCSECYEKVAPFIVPPIQNKPIRQYHHIRRAWMLASKLIQQADEVMIWGYSLPVTDHWSKWLLGHLWVPDARCQRLTLINPETMTVNRTTKAKTQRKSFVDKFLPWKGLSQTKIKVEGFEYYDDFVSQRKNRIFDV